MRVDLSVWRPAFGRPAAPQPSLGFDAARRRAPYEPLLWSLRQAWGIVPPSACRCAAARPRCSSLACNRCSRSGACPQSASRTLHTLYAAASRLSCRASPRGLSFRAYHAICEDRSPIANQAQCLQRPAQNDPRVPDGAARDRTALPAGRFIHRRTQALPAQRAGSGHRMRGSIMDRKADDRPSRQCRSTRESYDWHAPPARGTEHGTLPSSRGLSRRLAPWPRRCRCSRQSRPHPNQHPKRHRRACLHSPPPGMICATGDIGG